MNRKPRHCRRLSRSRPRRTKAAIVVCERRGERTGSRAPGTLRTTVRLSYMDDISPNRARAGRPIGTDLGLSVRVKPETVVAVDCWTARLPDHEKPQSRGEAVRRLLDETLEKKGIRPRPT